MTDGQGTQETPVELEKKMQALDRAPVGITITDPTQDDNPIVYANDAFCTLTGYDESEVVGRNCRFLQGEGTSAEQVARIRQALAANEPVTVELRSVSVGVTPAPSARGISFGDGTICAPPVRSSYALLVAS